MEIAFAIRFAMALWEKAESVEVCMNGAEMFVIAIAIILMTLFCAKVWRGRR